MKSLKMSTEPAKGTGWGSRQGDRHHLVWFKRDLRIEDHAPLVEAVEQGHVTCLFIYEPELIEAGEWTAAHIEFINECLAELDEAIRERGGILLVESGEAVAVLEKLRRETPFKTLWSHEETGIALTYQRDKRGKAWCRSKGVRWEERAQNGVFRPLRSRDGWSGRWEQRMRGDLFKPSRVIVPPPGIVSTRADLQSPGLLHAGVSDKPMAQRGGMREAQEWLDSFLAQRGVNYRSDMSSPVTGWNGCSRLSPYLAWGCVSMRRVVASTRDRVAELRGGSPMAVDPRWKGSLRSFEGRLRWHCHFIQKLEDEPRIEFENFVRAYDGLREEHTESGRGQDLLAAWQDGRTGYPMVDACMRCARETGWLNFRMRAMVVSFASYHLWLHWRATGLWLARHFLDFEPGVHWSQMQMQSGTSGINTLRIYSPAKQAKDQDPTGVFIRKWVPELAGVPDAYLSNPETLSRDETLRYGCERYPSPIVDPVEAPREARARIAAVRRQTATRDEAQRVYLKHGSRKRPRPRKATQGDAGSRRPKKLRRLPSGESAQPSLPGLAEE